MDKGWERGGFDGLVLVGVEDEELDIDGGVDALDGCAHCFELGGVAAVEDEVEVIRSELLRHASADAIAGAGDTGPWLRAVMVDMQPGGQEEGGQEDDDLVCDVGQSEDACDVDYLYGDGHTGYPAKTRGEEWIYQKGREEEEESCILDLLIESGGVEVAGWKPRASTL